MMNTSDTLYLLVSLAFAAVFAYLGYNSYTANGLSGTTIMYLLFGFGSLASAIGVIMRRQGMGENVDNVATLGGLGAWATSF
jgi:hypothetical protein